MNKSVEEIKVCSKCGRKLPIERFSLRYKANGKNSYRSLCKQCEYRSKKERMQKKRIEDFSKDINMKIPRHYKKVHPQRILNLNGINIELIGADEVFVKLLDYKNAWVSNYGRVVSYYNREYYLSRKKVNEDGEICYQINKNVFDGKNWVWRKKTVEAWRLVVNEFIVNYDIANNTYCWHIGNNKEDNYYKHLYPLNKYQYDAVMSHFEDYKDDSEEYILGVINSVDYKPDGWKPVYMKKSMFGIGYLGCSDADTKGEIYRKWANMMQRCYSEATHKIKPYYRDSRAHEEWWNFSNFREWYRENIIEGRKFDLDKDILVQGNNIYGSDTCSLVTHYANTIFQHRGIETNIVKSNIKGKFDASVSILGKTKEVGSFDTYEEAEKQLLLFRKETITKYANKNRNKVPYKVYEAMIKWEVAN